MSKLGKTLLLLNAGLLSLLLDPAFQRAIAAHPRAALIAAVASNLSHLIADAFKS